MTWHLSIENIAGIRRGEADVAPGVNAVRASNWQGKSSFLASIETAFGTATPLTEGQDAGRVTLTTDDDEYTVELRRENGTVTRSGRPYLTDEHDRVCAELFAFLDENNAVRRAVRNGDDVESLLTRPLDFENLDERIAALGEERDRVETELERTTEAASRLSRLQQRVTDLEAKLEDLRAERDELDDDDGDDDARERLSDLRAERDREASRIERLEATTERVRETLSEKRDEYESLSVPASDELEAELETLRADLREVERDRELLQSVYESNRRVLDEGRVDLLTDVSHEVISDSVTCWLCGADTTREDVETQLAALDRRVGELRDRAGDLRDRVEELEAKRDEAQSARRRERDLRDRIGELETRLAEKEESLDAAREKRETLDERVDALAADVDTTESRLTDLDSEIKYVEAELSDAREELESTRARAETRETLEAEYESLTEEMTALRRRKTVVKDRMREAFSDALDELLARLETGFETARLTGTFELVVARDGREARLDALSEGERELLGFVAALAGYEAFDVGDRVPVMLLDGLGGLAGGNIRVLVEYLDDRTEYLVLTAYPEHADFDGHELSPADWRVVSDDSDAEAVP